MNTGVIMSNSHSFAVHWSPKGIQFQLVPVTQPGSRAR